MHFSQGPHLGFCGHSLLVIFACYKCSTFECLPESSFWPLGYFLEVCSQKDSYWVRGSSEAMRFLRLISRQRFLETRIWLLGQLAWGGGARLPHCPPCLASFPWVERVPC